MRENRWPEITSELTPKAGGPSGKDSVAVTAEHHSLIHSLHCLESDTGDPVPDPRLSRLLGFMANYNKIRQKSLPH